MSVRVRVVMSKSRSARPQERPNADDSPDGLQHDKPHLKGMERNPGKNRGARRIQDVVSCAARVDPSQLMTDVCDQDQERSDEGNQLTRKVHIHVAFTVAFSACSRSMTLETATPMGPSSEQPLAHLWPPPPKCSATAATFTSPLLRKLTCQRLSGN